MHPTPTKRRHTAAAKRRAMARLEALEVRTLLTGGVDPTFAEGGFLQTTFSDVAVQSDGRILTISGSEITRRNPDGSIDTTFGGGDGRISTPIPAGLLELAGGKIFVAGTNSGRTAWLIARLNPDGSLDTTFSPGGADGSGIATFRSPDPLAASHALAELAIAPDGKIVLGGEVYRFPEPQSDLDYVTFTAARLNADGSLDTTFGQGDGEGYLFIPKTGFFGGLAVAPNGSVAVGGTSVFNSGRAIDVRIENPDGSVEFGGYGESGWGGPYGSPELTDLAYTSNGTLVLVTNQWVDFGNSRIAIGQENGLAETFYTDAFPQPDGKVLVASRQERGTLNDTSVAQITRLTSSGTVDPTFGVNGTVTIDLDASNTAGALAVKPDGKVLVGVFSGPAGAQQPTPHLARLTTPESPPPAQSPFGGTPPAVGTLIQAENFDTGGEGVAYHDTDPGNQSGTFRAGEGVDVANITTANVVGRAHKGEWLEYIFNVNAPTDRLLPYNLAVRYTTPKTGVTLQYFVDDQSVGHMTLPSTGSYGSYQTATTRVNLPGGRHVLRVLISSGGNDTGNYDHFQLTAATDAQAPTRPTWLNAFGNFDDRVQLSWVGANDDVQVTSYDVFRNGVKVATVPAGGDTAYTDTGLSSGTEYRYHVVAVDSSGNRSATSDTQTHQTTGQQPGQTPFTGTPFQPNQIIQAEDFDNGGEGAAFHDSDSTNQGGRYRNTGVDIENSFDIGGGYNVGYTRQGEWLEYTFTLPQAGEYDIQIRLAAVQTGFISFDVDNVDSGTIVVNPTPGFQSYVTRTNYLGQFSAGTHVLRLEFGRTEGTRGVANVNWLRIVPRSQTDTTPPSAVPNFRATGTGDRTVSLAWDAAADNVAVTGYRLRRDGSIIATLPADARSYTATGLTNAVTYGFTIEAIDGANNEGPESTVTATPNVGGTGPAGLTGTYFDNDNFTTPVFTRVDYGISFNWDTGSPDPRIAPDAFSVRWTGQIRSNWTGTHTFFLNADDRAKLIINGQTVINYIPGQTPSSGSIHLDAGEFYDITVEHQEFGGRARAILEWLRPGNATRFSTAGFMYPDSGNPQTPAPGPVRNLRATAGSGTVTLFWDAPADATGVDGYHLTQNGAQLVSLGGDARSYTVTGLTNGQPYTFGVAAASSSTNLVGPTTTVTATPTGSPSPGTNGLTGRYFNKNTGEFSGSPVLTRADGNVNFDWAYGSPAPGVNVDNFSVQWTGKIRPPATGSYTFFPRGDDWARVYINGVQVSQYNPGSNIFFNNPVTLSAGQSYDITIEFFEKTGRARATLEWSGPDIPRQLVPSAYLFTS